MAEGMDAGETRQEKASMGGRTISGRIIRGLGPGKSLVYQAQDREELRTVQEFVSGALPFDRDYRQEIDDLNLTYLIERRE